MQYFISEIYDKVSGSYLGAATLSCNMGVRAYQPGGLVTGMFDLGSFQVGLYDNMTGSVTRYSIQTLIGLAMDRGIQVVGLQWSSNVPTDVNTLTSVCLSVMV